MSGTYVSLFSGIGGLDLAVEQHGFECVGQVEWDESCTRVLERWWPTVPRWGDVREFTAAAYAECQPVRAPGRGDDRGAQGAGSGEGAQRQWLRAHDGHGVDLVAGGFPCQPASHAGRRKGTEDDRWLWPEFARVVGELGPRLVLVENVSGLLTVNGGRAFSEVVGTLADLGYDATWTSLRAADVGACHRRERIFLLAERSDPDGIGFLGAGEREGSRRAEQPGQLRDEPQHLAGHVGATLASDAEDIGRERSGEPRGRRDGSPNGFAWGAYEPAIRRWERVVMRPAPMPVDGKGRLAPAFVEWMMGFPEGWTDRMSRTQALKALGNAVVPQQGAAALARLLRLTEVAA